MKLRGLLVALVLGNAASSTDPSAGPVALNYTASTTRNTSVLVDVTANFNALLYTDATYWWNISAVGQPSNGTARVDFLRSLPGFSYTSFGGAGNLTLYGSATLDSNTLQLTSDSTSQAGTAFYSHMVDIVDFELSFRFQMFRPTCCGGADGMAFVIHNDPRGVQAVGSFGAGLGYEGVSRSIAIELDAYVNEDTAADPDGAHIGVHTRYNLANSGHEMYRLGNYSAQPSIKDGNVHMLRVRYQPLDLRIFLDDLANPILTIPINIPASIALASTTRAFVGFSASTGAIAQVHRLISWNMTNYFTGAMRVLYTPLRNFSGIDRFPYTLTDSLGRTASGYVTVYVDALTCRFTIGNHNPPTGTVCGAECVANFVCYGGYSVNGSSTAVCINGVWDRRLPNCIPSPCVVRAPGNGSATTTQGVVYDYGNGNASTVLAPSSTYTYYDCLPGFTLAGYSPLWCSRGVLQGADPECYAQCTYNIAHGPSGTRCGYNCAPATFYCDAGYVLSGASSSRCTNGAWSPPLPTCERLWVRNYTVTTAFGVPVTIDVTQDFFSRKFADPSYAWLVQSVSQPSFGNAEIVSVASPNFAYANFSDVDLIVVAPARVTPAGLLQLTDNAVQQTGGVFFPVMLDMVDFDLTVRFRVHTPRGSGGDGMAVVFHNEPTWSGYLGFGTSGLGYAYYLRSCLAVELDMYSNSDLQDPALPHISIHTRYDTANYHHESARVGRNYSTTAIKDGLPHDLRIRHSAGLMEIYLDETTNVHPKPVTSAPISMVQSITLSRGRRAWVGITAATGTQGEYHEILAANYTSRFPAHALRYTPPDGFVGTTTFSYAVGDTLNASATGLVTVTVLPPPTSGTTGSSGTVGSTGTTGSRASSGSTGSVGSSGSSRTTGSSGSVGSSGSSGSSGSVRSSGSSGSTGTTGSLRSSGSTGSTGSYGSSGSARSTGSTGTVRSSGSTGSSGTVRTSGTTGSLRSTGSTGSFGSTGSIGTVRSTGSTGSSGTLRTSGSTGSVRSTGSSGTVRSTGSTGSSGSARTSGTTGSVRSTGSTGTSGSMRSTGSSGSVGSSGSTGTTSTGSSGSVRSTGSTGSSGTSGTSGTTGLHLYEHDVSFLVDDDGGAVLFEVAGRRRTCSCSGVSRLGAVQVGNGTSVVCERHLSVRLPPASSDVVGVVSVPVDWGVPFSDAAHVVVVATAVTPAAAGAVFVVSVSEVVATGAILNVYRADRLGGGWDAELRVDIGLWELSTSVGAVT